MCEMVYSVENNISIYGTLINKLRKFHDDKLHEFKIYIVKSKIT